LNGLISGIGMGTIALPEIQRPFVWPNAKIRNLFDSMYRGYPVGFFLFWEPADPHNTKAIGVEAKHKAAKLLVVDGQQRLTSLFAVVTGTPVIRKGYSEEKIEISFNPFSEEFAVADASTRNNKSYISNITDIWDPEIYLDDFKSNYFTRLKEGEELPEEAERQARRAIDRLANLTNFPFTALELTHEVDEEQVAEVFVRINSEGKTLNQADFILTLMSVFQEQLRKDLEAFSRASKEPTNREVSAFNYLFQPEPDQMLRTGVGLAFRRARLKFVYSILRGKDLETEEFSVERREEQFGSLASAQAEALDLQNWHEFLKAIRSAGYHSQQMISSQNALIFAYILYLIGRTELKVDESKLRKLIAKWFFITSLSRRYSSSPETKMEADLARFRDVTTADHFISIIEEICASIATNDYWEITLPLELATSSARSPSLFAYFAALSILDAKVLFSKKKVFELLDPSTRAPRSAIERHHLFTRDYLDKIGRTKPAQKNQIANLALVEWLDNANIGARPPSDYFKEHASRIDAKTMERMMYWHALPDGWQNMEYESFLQQRREMIANVIHEAYVALDGGDSQTNSYGVSRPINELVAEGEGSLTEFKSTLRRNLHTGENDQRMEQSALKTIVGFLNSRGGGKLFIGVDDEGEAIGVEADGFSNEDKMLLHLNNLVKSRIGTQHLLYIHPYFDELDGQRVLVVDCLPARSPAYMKDGNEERFYARSIASTAELKGQDISNYIKARF
jgi:hypothetical protein